MIPESVSALRSGVYVTNSTIRQNAGALGHERPVGLDGGRGPAVAGDDPVTVFDGHNHERLDDARLSDRVGELVEVAKVEAGVGRMRCELVRVEPDEQRVAGPRLAREGVGGVEVGVEVDGHWASPC